MYFLVEIYYSTKEKIKYLYLDMFVIRSISNNDRMKDRYTVNVMWYN